jgi:hypothetical protein
MEGVALGQTRVPHLGIVHSMNPALIAWLVSVRVGGLLVPSRELIGQTLISD